MRTTKLIDAFGDVLTDGGLFSVLNTLNVPWKNDVPANTLDLEYFYNISGQKSISPLLRRFLNGATTITSAQKTTLANVLYDMYIKQWNKEYATLNLEYNPISNYDMTETEVVENIRESEGHNTGTQATAHTGTSTDQHGGTQTNAGTSTVSGGSTSNTQNDVYGFNSSQGSPNEETDTTNSTSSTVTDSTTRTDNLTDTRTDNLTDTRTDNLTNTENASENIERTLTRSGNIGITTSQQMATAERELWLWNFFFEIVFPDIDEILTLAIYQR